MSPHSYEASQQYHHLQIKKKLVKALSHEAQLPKASIVTNLCMYRHLCIANEV
jgi:hypothetical protein